MLKRNCEMRLGFNNHVNRFFNSRHPSQYRIYNLCAEDKYQYNSAHFENNGIEMNKEKNTKQIM